VTAIQEELENYVNNILSSHEIGTFHVRNFVDPPLEPDFTIGAYEARQFLSEMGGLNIPLNFQELGETYKS